MEIIIKPERDRDLYVGWSTSMDAPTRYGKRAWWERQPDVHDAQLRLDYADEHGTSWEQPGPYGWDHQLFRMRVWHRGTFLLPRKQLVRAVSMAGVHDYQWGPVVDVLHLEPVPDDDEPACPCTPAAADAACPEHGVKSFLADLLQATE